MAKGEVVEYWVVGDRVMDGGVVKGWSGEEYSE